MTRVFLSATVLLFLLLLPNSYALDGDTDIQAAVKAWQPRMFGRGSEVRGPLDAKEVERQAMAEIKKCHDCPQVPFGYNNDRWQEFKRELEEGGGVLVYFRTDDKSWQALAGREGYVIVRGGKVGSEFITRLN